jgi:hypothetical protein
MAPALIATSLSAFAPQIGDWSLKSASPIYLLTIFSLLFLSSTQIQFSPKKITKDAGRSTKQRSHQLLCLPEAQTPELLFSS